MPGDGVSEGRSRLDGVSESRSWSDGVSEGRFRLDGVFGSRSWLDGVSESRFRLDGVFGSRSWLDGVSVRGPRRVMACPKGARPQSDICPHRVGYPIAYVQMSDWGLAPFGQAITRLGPLANALFLVLVVFWVRCLSSWSSFGCVVSRLGRLLGALSLASVPFRTRHHPPLNPGPCGRAQRYRSSRPRCSLLGLDVRWPLLASRSSCSLAAVRPQA